LSGGATSIAPPLHIPFKKIPFRYGMDAIPARFDACRVDIRRPVARAFRNAPVLPMPFPPFLPDLPD
jgi:hypothetical protein